MITKQENFIRKSIREELDKFDWNKENVAADAISPPQYVYHISDKQHRNSILQNGLNPSVGDSYKGWAQTDNAIPAIFATIGKNLNDITGGIKLERFQADIWQIDTTKSTNDWFVDKHFEGFKKFDIDNPHIVTFEKIPSFALKLIHKQF